MSRATACAHGYTGEHFCGLCATDENGDASEEVRRAAERKEPTSKLCEDLRHVCGKCGFQWPERSAYDEMMMQNAHLRYALTLLANAVDQRDVRGAIADHAGDIGAIGAVRVAVTYARSILSRKAGPQ